jgi:hypothetical protein
MGNTELLPNERANVYKFVTYKELIPKLMNLNNPEELIHQYPVCYNFDFYQSQTRNGDNWIYTADLFKLNSDFWVKSKHPFNYYIQYYNDNRDYTTDKFPAKFGLTKFQYDILFK